MRVGSEQTTLRSEVDVSHFFAYLSRMKLIQRWGLMHNARPENVAEHSLRVAQIAHVLALLRNRRHGGDVDPEEVALAALYHDATEVITGDMPGPIKYFNPDIRSAYAEIERAAADTLLAMLPDDLRADFAPVFADADPQVRELVKAADKLCAWLKCREELAAGNREFARAEESLRATVRGLDLPEVEDFVATFAPSIGRSLDELG